MTLDPLGFEDGLNIYAYVHNNPLRYFDPDGQVAILIPIFCIAFGAEVTISVATINTICVAVGTAALYWSAEKVHDYYQNNYCKEDVDDVDQKEEKDKKHNGDQQAISGLVKESGKNGVSNSDADTLLDWAKEYDFPHRDDRGKPPHWVGGEHIHIGPRHVPVNN